ncbi:MAG: RNA polymerase sigma factor [Sedimentisphaerales bacterium]|nr:RNA polymerase sigma factor [Sedimentisphaerales bacterium]
MVCAARRGDRRGLEELFLANAQWLKALLFSILGNAADAEDALQTVCVLLLDKIHSVKDPESFKPWLATVARNAALTQRQKRFRRPLAADETLERLAGDPAADPTVQADQREQHRRILAALSWLPEKYREVFLLKYAQDLTYAQIGEILNLPTTTVQIRLVRARRMLLNRLTGKPTDKIPRT